MTAPSAAADRSDLRHVLVSGTKIGLLTAAAVTLALAVHRSVPAGVVQVVLATAVVLLGATCAGLLPGRWAAARTAEGVAGAAAIGLWGSVVFMAVDIVVLRPVKAYPWTWDAIGGGSTWWYLPVWWMLGTYLAWMGGMLAAGRSARGRDRGLVATALPPLAGGLAVAAIAAMLGVRAPFPVTAGAGFTVTLTALALLAIRRQA